MSFRGSTTIVALPRPRVGKTLQARLLTDFHLHEGRSVAAYDLNAGERTLAQFLPDLSRVPGTLFAHIADRFAVLAPLGS